MPIVIDTDINEEKGADSDDAFALVYAARMMDVAAITISPCEDAQKRASFVRRLLTLAGKKDISIFTDIPVWPVQQDCTICALGPMTNVSWMINTSGKEMIGRIILTASLIASPVKDVYLIDGHNMRCDREAMVAVEKSNIPMDFVGKDVREQTRLTRADCVELEATGTELGKLLATVHRNWLDCWNADDSGMHDQLTVASHLIADYVKWKEVGWRRRVLQSVDSAAFKRHFMQEIFNACYGR
jgi:inosine-uridine nucleoside N-ribohydrolase